MRSAYTNLDRLGLLSLDNASAARTVWLHPTVRAAVRAYLAAGNVEQVVTAAAAALLEAWPEPGAPGHTPQLSQARRSDRHCATAPPRCAPSPATCSGSRTPTRCCSGPARR